MNTVVIGVSSPEEMNSRFVRAMSGETQGAFRNFQSADDLWRTITPRRWALLQAMTGVGEVSMRELARRVGRDVKGVHGGVHTLLNAGLIDKTEQGKLVFPFDSVHIDFMLKAAA